MYIIPTLQKLLVDPELTNMKRAKFPAFKECTYVRVVFSHGFSNLNLFNAR